MTKQAVIHYDELGKNEQFPTLAECISFYESIGFTTSVVGVHESQPFGEAFYVVEKVGIS